MRTMATREFPRSGVLGNLTAIQAALLGPPNFYDDYDLTIIALDLGRAAIALSIVNVVFRGDNTGDSLYGNIFLAVGGLALICWHFWKP